MQAIQTSEVQKLAQKRQWVFFITYIVVALLAIRLIFVLPNMPGSIGLWMSKNCFLFIGFATFAAQRTADLMCGWFGLSLAGKSLQTVQRQTGGVPFPLTQNLIIKPSFLRYYPFIGLLVVILIDGNSIDLLDNFPHINWLLITLVAVNLYIIPASFFALLNRTKPVLQVDENGIAFCGICGVRSGFIAWQEIASCELEVQRGTLGDLQQQTFRFKDANGQKLVNLTYPYQFLRSKQDGVVNGDRLGPFWLLIQKGLTGEYDESTVEPLELVPQKETLAPTIPPRIIERDNQLPDAERRIEKPLIIHAGLSRILTAGAFSFFPFFFFAVLYDINPLSPASRLPATFDHTTFEGWPIWLIMTTAVFSFVCIIAFAVVAFLWWPSITKPDLVIDDEGIRYRGSGELKSKTLKWEQIAVCEVGTGKSWSSGKAPIILLKDAQGKELLKMNIDFNLEPMNIENARRVADVIEKYLTGRVAA